jgi:outer membrane receptor for ferrienterochelin and colicins
MKNAIIILTLAGIVTYSTTYAQERDTLKAEDILNMSFSDLMNIKVITASKTRQSIKDVPATVHVITEKQIKERAYFTLDEALSDLPGFQFRNILGFNSYVFMRGVPSQNNLILLMVDGVQINELNSGGFYSGGQFILSDIEQIEIVYGPASALYGTNAVSGIINLITKNPSGNRGHISILGGDFRTGMVNFDLSAYNSSKDLGVIISGQYKTTQKADLAGDKGDNNWTEDMENFENDLSLSAKLKAGHFSSGVVFQEKKSSMTTNFKSVGDTSLDRNTLWDIVFLNAFLKYTNDRHEKWSYNSTAYYRNSTVRPNTIYQIVKATATNPGKQTGYFRPNHLLGLENQFTYKPNNRFLFIGGIVGEAEALSEAYSVTYSSSQDTPPPRPEKPKILNNYLFSYYSQMNYSIFKQITISGGIRHDFSSYYGQVFIPRIGLIYNYDKFTAKALYNKAFRSPKPWDYNFGTGNANLKPEKMRSLEFCLSYLIKENFDLGGSVFYNVIDDKLIQEKTATVYRWINKNTLKTTGFEVYGNYHIGKIDLYANYSFNNSTDQDGAFIPEIAKHSANAGVSFSFTKAVGLNFRANYLGDRENPYIIPSTGNNKIDDALVFNGCITYSGFKNFDIQLKVNNILNEKYYHPSNRFEGRYRQPQRTFLMCATYNFRLGH